MRPNRVEAAFARYNLEVDETEWDTRTKAPHERVHKNIRMRIRYTCHNCSTTFGRDRVCVGCEHRRCTRCSRYPPKKDRPKVTEDAQSAPPSQPQSDAPQASAEGVICHECQSGSEVEAEECPNCHHKICDRCVHLASISFEPSQATSSQSAGTAARERDSQQRTASQQEQTAVS